MHESKRIFVLLAVLCARTAAAQPTATLVLTPACAEGQPSALEVELSLPLAGRPRFRLDDRVQGDAGMARLVEDAAASDARGRLPLARRDSPEGLELGAGRAAVGVVTLRYRARSIPTAEEGARFGLRHDATGIGGQGAFFLVLPEGAGRHRLRLEWRAGTCGPMETLSSLSSGQAAPLETLRGAVYFAGHPQLATSGNVRAAWFGRPALDVQAATDWAARAFAAERAFFRDGDPGPYQLFVRVLPAMEARANGIGQPSALLTVIGPQTTFGPALRRNLAHEILHRWIGLRLRIAGPEGSGYWFSEGFTVHYAATLAFRAGLLSPDEMLAELELITSRYFSNPHAGATNEQIQRGFFANPELSVVPYVRGALYAAELDAAIRVASRGRRSLDDLVLGLRGEVSATDFRAAIRRELGPAGVARFEAVILGGARPAPPSDAYGPCFRQIASGQGFRWERAECRL